MTTKAPAESVARMSIRPASPGRTHRLHGRPLVCERYTGSGGRKKSARNRGVLRKNSPGSFRTKSRSDVTSCNVAGILPSQLRMITKGETAICGVSVVSSSFTKRDFRVLLALRVIQPTNADIIAFRLSDADLHVQKLTPYGRSLISSNHVARLRRATLRLPCRPVPLFRGLFRRPVRNTAQPPSPARGRLCCHPRLSPC